ncbi:MAG TPA: hypothetical protein VF105_05010 [Gemmatimonadaceae bacterium]
MPNEATFQEQHPSDAARRAKTACDDLRHLADGSGRAVAPESLCEELHIAVEQAALRSAGSINALRLAVKRFTVALRDDGAKPEAVLIAIKDVINSRTFPVDAKQQDWHPDEMRQQISKWSIEEFFSAKQA